MNLSISNVPTRSEYYDPEACMEIFVPPQIEIYIQPAVAIEMQTSCQKIYKLVHRLLNNFKIEDYSRFNLNTNKVLISGGLSFGSIISGFNLGLWAVVLGALMAALGNMASTIFSLDMGDRARIIQLEETVSELRQILDCQQRNVAALFEALPDMSALFVSHGIDLYQLQRDISSRSDQLSLLSSRAAAAPAATESDNLPVELYQPR